MLKKIVTGALSVAALALTLGLAAPQSAEARIVCSGGWGWHAGHCVRIHRVHYVPRYIHRVHYVPHHRWHHHGYYYGHYYR